MAATLTINGQVTFNNGTTNGLSEDITTGTLTISLSGDKSHRSTQTIGTSAENIEKGDLGTLGFAMFHNRDETNFVEIGYDDTGFRPFLKLEPGEWTGPVRLTQSTPQAKADTGAVDLEYILIED